jgi:imidazole glycerol phosphate synthase glutamine amidotransferase subunit
MTTERRLRFAVVDYGASNLVSFEQALVRVGVEVVIATGADGLVGVDALVVPGVGAAAPAMARLHAQDLVEPIRDWIRADRPCLGVCLGMQLLFEGSDEDGAQTLGILGGRTRRLVDAPTLPHIGWNQVDLVRDHPAFAGIARGSDFYFVHSYAGVPAPADTGAVVATTTHGQPFVSAVAVRNLIGVQFHPEKSGDDGLRLHATVATLVRGAAVPA